MPLFGLQAWRRRIVLASLFLAAIVGLLCVMALPGPDRGRDLLSSSPAEIELICRLRLLRSKAAPPIEQLAADITERGSGAVDLMLQILAERIVPGLDGGELQALSIYQEELILTSLEILGREEVWEKLAPVLSDPPSNRLHAASILALGAIAGSRDMAYFLAVDPPEDSGLDAYVSEALRKGVTRFLLREPDEIESLVRSWRHADPGIVEPLVAAVGDAQEPRGVEFLGEVIRWRSDLTPQAVSQLRRLGRHPSAEINQEIAAELREQLHAWDSSPGLVRAVVLSLGELQDFHSIPMLMALMEDESKGLRDNALWSLQRMTGMRLGEDVEAWQRWYETEMNWFLDQRPKAISDLGSADPGVVSRAIRAYSTRRIFCHELARDLSEVFSRDEAHLRILACGVLGQLASPVAIPELVYTLLEDDPDLREAAHAALQAITGKDLPPDAEVWRDELDLDL